MPSPIIPILLVAGLFALGRRSKSSKVCPQLGGGVAAGIKYKEYVFGKPHDPLPIIIHFHSRGTSPDFFKKYYENVGLKFRLILPYGKLGNNKNPVWFDTPSTGDQNKLSNEIVSVAEELGPFVELIDECIPHMGKPIITGHSQGAILANAMAVGAPGRFSYNIPVSGWLPQSLWSKTITPTIAIHGSKDKTVPFQRTENMVSKMHQKGAPIDLVTIAGAGHSFSDKLESAWKSVLRQAIEKM